MRDISKIIIQNFPNIITTIESSTAQFQPFQIAVLIFEYFKENSGFMKAVLGPKGDLSFQTKLKAFMWRTIFENEANPFIKGEDLLVPANYLASYIASAHIGVIQQWLNSGTKETPEEMARILSTIMLNGPLFAAGLKK